MKKRTIGITAAAVAGTAVLAGGAAIAFAAGSAPTPATALVSTSTPASDTSSPSPSPSASFVDDRVAAADIDRAIQAALEAAGPGTVVDADTDDDATHAYEIDILRDAGGVAEVKLDAAFQVVSVTADDRGGDRDDDDGDRDGRDDELLTDAARVHAASAAALAHVGSGRVVSVELSDDADHVYEVEVELGDGDDIDVELDASFNVLRAH